MKRLVVKSQAGSLYYNDTQKGVKLEPHEITPHQRRLLLERLYTYEDTGLTPEQIRELKERDTAKVPVQFGDEEEAIEILEEIKELDDTLYAYNAAYMDALEVALFALKEIQNYRKLGTVEELARAKRYIYLAKQHGTIGQMIDSCAEYEEIGTVEECREAREKWKPKKCVEDSCPDHTHYKCPSCGKIQKTKYDDSTFGCILNNCSNCGQALIN